MKYFGDDYQPEPYIVEEYKRARDSKYYETSRLICVNDIYAFDPNAKVNLDQFEDIIGRNFRQPKEGPRLGQQPVRAHVADHHVADAVPVSAVSEKIGAGRGPPRFHFQCQVRSSTRSQLR